MNALVDISKALTEAGFILAETSFAWNADGTVLRTEDGFYGGITRHDEAGYFWSVTPPAGPPKRGRAVHPDAARAAVEFLITEMRGAHHA